MTIRGITAPLPVTVTARQKSALRLPGNSRAITRYPFSAKFMVPGERVTSN
jgi:hypothetical protein